MHEQGDEIYGSIGKYERSLSDKGLPDIPAPRIAPHERKDDYADLDPAIRKRMLSTFRVFFRHLPIRYFCLALRTREYPTPRAVEDEMRRRLIGALFDDLGYLQGFDTVKIYYDNGQKAVATALHKAIDYALSKNAVVYMPADPAPYRLSQVADYLCTVELTGLKFADHATTATDEKFFGSWSMFKKGVLKEARMKAL